MSVVLGCIGCGNMGSAILEGLASCDELKRVAFDTSVSRMNALEQSGIAVMTSISALVEASDIILVAVKPRYVDTVLAEAQSALTQGKVLVSIASGVSIAALRQASAGVCPVVRVMPNTPAMVGAGVFALCFDDPQLPETQAVVIQRLFASLGRVMVLPESRFTAFTAVAGCGPAYVFHFMEAIVESAVTLGFTRQEATDMVTDLFAGSVKLAAESDTHLSLLREAVCSPAGNTIAAMNQLDRSAVRGSIIDAVLAAYARGLEMER